MSPVRPYGCSEHPRLLQTKHGNGGDHVLLCGGYQQDPPGAILLASAVAGPVTVKVEAPGYGIGIDRTAIISLDSATQGYGSGAAYGLPVTITNNAASATCQPKRTAGSPT